MKSPRAKKKLISADQKLISANQKLKIKNKGLNQNQLFSKYSDQVLDLSGDMLELSMDGDRRSAAAAKIQKKKEIKNKLGAVKNQPTTVKDLFEVKKDPKRASLRDVTPNKIRPAGPSEPAKPKKRPKNNKGLVVKTICRQLGAKDAGFIKLIVDRISPALAFKLANKVFTNQVIDGQLNENEYNELEMVDKFVQLIEKDKHISNKAKKTIVAQKLAMDQKGSTQKCLKASAKRKRSQIKETVDSLNADLDKLALENGLISVDNQAKPKKKIDFK